MATTRDVWGGAWGTAWLNAWTITESEDSPSGGYPSRGRKKGKSSYQVQMEGLASLPIINKHYPLPLQVDMLVDPVTIEEDTEEEDIRAIMLLIH